jgi:hypothetical protein
LHQFHLAEKLLLAERRMEGESPVFIFDCEDGTKGITRRSSITSTEIKKEEIESSF